MGLLIIDQAVFYFQYPTDKEYKSNLIAPFSKTVFHALDRCGKGRRLGQDIQFG